MMAGKEIVPVQIADNIWKIPASSNIYVLKLRNTIVIDTGRKENKESVRKAIDSLVGCDDVDYVILTHLHYDHCSNIGLFPNAKILASADEIAAYKKNPFGAVLDPEAVRMVRDKLAPVGKQMSQLKPLRLLTTPGHTLGSICLYYAKEKILFSGDTLFEKGVGRTDLPTSVPKELEPSLAKLKKLKYRILCAGHEY